MRKNAEQTRMQTSILFAHDTNSIYVALDAMLKVSIFLERKIINGSTAVVRNVVAVA